MRRLFLLTAWGILIAAPSRVALAEKIELLIPHARTPAVLAEGANGMVVAGYRLRDLSGSEIFVVPQGGNGTIFPFGSGTRILTANGTPGGVTLSATHGSFIPVFYFFVSPGGSVLRRPEYPAIAPELSGFSIGDSGRVGFVGRFDNSAGNKVVYKDDPLSDPHAQPLDTSAILSGDQEFGNSTLVDAAGRLYVVRISGSGATVYQQESVPKWTPLVNGPSSMFLLDMAPDYRFLYATSLNSGLIYRSDRPFDGLGVGGQLFYASLANTGAIAAAGGTSAYYITPEGDFVNLGALAGAGNTPSGLLSMNAQGEVAMITQGSENKLWWFDGGQLHLIATGLPELFTNGHFNQQPLLLTSTREIYFYALEGTSGFNVQLFRVQVPEPAGAVGAWLAAAMIMSRRPRRS